MIIVIIILYGIWYGCVSVLDASKIRYKLVKVREKQNDKMREKQRKRNEVEKSEGERGT